jgi:hypothetical protein
MKVIELNRPAISSRLSIKNLSVKPYVSHMMYMSKDKIIQTASLETPVYRLAKDYEIDGLVFAINLLTDDNDAGKAERFMDRQAKLLIRDEVSKIIHSSRPFTYLNKNYRSKK